MAKIKWNPCAYGPKLAEFWRELIAKSAAVAGVPDNEVQFVTGCNSRHLSDHKRPHQVKARLIADRILKAHVFVSGPVEGVSRTRARFAVWIDSEGTGMTWQRAAEVAGYDPTAWRPLSMPIRGGFWRCDHSTIVYWYKPIMMIRFGVECADITKVVRSLADIYGGRFRMFDRALDYEKYMPPMIERPIQKTEVALATTST